MGRRPNLLIRENFVRGPKLKNSTNRYHHTCKNCGERFPKGRIDTLTNHLTKQCRALTADERMRILSRVGRMRDQSQTDPDMSLLHKGSLEELANLPFEPAPTFDGLNVLAEASRQVGATERPKANVHAVQGEDPFLLNTTLDTPMNDVLSSNPLLPFQQLQTRPQIHQPPSPSPGVPPLALTSAGAVQIPARSSTELHSIVVPVDDIVNHDILHTGQDISRMYEPQVDMNSLENTLENDVMAKDASALSSYAAAHPRPIAVRPKKGYQTDPLIISEHKPSKNRGRARFSADRRKEVSDLRKLGACLRCRILRKPCSAEDPCKSCSAIANSRTWTWPCSRARIAHEIQVYSSGLHCNIAHKELGLVTDQLQFRSISCPLEIFHSTRGTHRELFRGAKLSVEQSLEQSQMTAKTENQYLILVDDETEDISEKMHNYVKQSTIDVYEEESSSPVKVTIEMALSSIASEQIDTLLSSVVELWIATNLLVRKKEDWNLHLQGTLTPTENITINNGSINSASHDLITTQLLSAIEKTAEKLCHDVANQLEQRFMRKLHEGAFGTFLASIIMLNCVERMSWLYLAWHVSDDSRESSKWPLDDPPVHYVESGERFCEILALLLRVRELIPSIGLHRHVHNEYMQPISPIDDGIKRWISNIQATQEYLEQRLNAQFDPEDFRSMDMKLISGLLHVIVLTPPDGNGKDQTNATK